MPRDRQEALERIGDRLSRLSRRLAAGWAAGERRLDELRAHLESARDELEHRAARSVRNAIERAGATVEEMEREDAAPPTDAMLRRDELEALRRHLQLTAELVPHVSNLDDPGWARAYEEYERSWDELHDVMERAATPSR